MGCIPGKWYQNGPHRACREGLGMWMAHEQGPGKGLCYTLLVLWGCSAIQPLCTMLSLRCAGILSELLHKARIRLSHRTRPSHCCEGIWQVHFVA